MKPQVGQRVSVWAAHGPPWYKAGMAGAVQGPGEDQLWEGRPIDGPWFRVRMDAGYLCDFPLFVLRPFEVGQRVSLVGLPQFPGQSHRSGEEGVIHSYSAAIGRWLVQLDRGGRLITAPSRYLHPGPAPVATRTRSSHLPSASAAQPLHSAKKPTSE